MRGANGGSGNTVPLRVIPERRDFPEHLVQSARAKGADVFDDDPRRPDFLDEPAVLAPEAGTLAAESCPLASGADVLAGEASANNVNWPDIGAGETADIFVNWHSRPVLCEDGAAVGVDLAEGDWSESACSFESKAETADARKEVEDTEGHRSTNAFVPKTGTIVDRLPGILRPVHRVVLRGTPHLRAIGERLTPVRATATMH